MGVLKAAQHTGFLGVILTIRAYDLLDIGGGGGGHGSPICIAALNQTPTSRICALYAQSPHSLKLQVQAWVVSKVLTATLSTR